MVATDFQFVKSTTGKDNEEKQKTVRCDSEQERAYLARDCCPLERD